VADFLSYGQFYKRPCVAYEMERALSIDIDEPLDLELVELMMANAGGAK
jgi:CMP-N-acetylneuraminic acid synthetase